MNVTGTNMHIVVGIISLFEILMLFFQIVYYLQRPSDKSRLWFLFLLVLLIQYNLAGSLLPDDRLNIEIKYQYIYTYFTGIIMSMYIIFYFYKAFHLHNLKWIATNGMIFFVLLPYLFLFAIPYYFVDNFYLFNKLIVIIPGLYAFIVGKAIYKNLLTKIKSSRENHTYKKEIENSVIVATSYLFWISLPVVTYFEGPELLEHSLTNFGFLLMTFAYIRTTIYDSQKEFQDLMNAKEKLENINENLQNIVKSRTKEVEILAEEQKNTFINLVHETKTPLTLLQNYIEDYIKLNNSKELENAWQVLQKISSDINNLFDLDRYKNGFPIYTHDTIINISKRLSDLVLIFEPLSTNKGIKITVSISPDIKIKSASDAFDRIAFNLIDNAIKYSTNGNEIIIELSKLQNIAILLIRDYGEGIPDRILSTIFEPYSQIKSANKGNKHGMGLGLPIVKKIIESLSGQIEIITKPRIEIGSIFKVMLPISEVEIEVNSPNIKYTPYSLDEEMVIEFTIDDNKKSILLVEDKNAVKNYLYKKLSVQYNLILASNGKEALNKLKKYGKVIHLIITDIMLPEMDGHEFMKIKSQIKDFELIPIIIISAKDTLQDRSKSYNLGAINFINKPFNYKDLFQIISNTLKLSSAIGAEIRRDNLLSLDVNNQFNLTHREITIIKLLKKGKTNKVISEELYISPNTVGTHIQNIYQKVGASNKIELINKLEGLISAHY